jgi:hypothetical protein
VIAQRSDLVFPANRQSPTGAHRASLEIGTGPSGTQPVLRDSGRIAYRGRFVLRPMAEAQPRTSAIMRRYLRRYA